MDKISGAVENGSIEYKDFPAHVDEVVCLKGMVHRIREMTGFAFIIIPEMQRMYSTMSDIIRP